MSFEITNRNLSILLLIFMAISLGTTFYHLQRLTRVQQIPFRPEGYVTNPTGQAKINITGLASLRFSVAVVDFGTGYVNTTAGNQYCSMATINQSAGYIDPIANCVGFIKVNSSLQIEDDGNTNLSLTISSSLLPSTFIGGTVPVFKYQGVNNESSSCKQPSPALWTDFNNNQTEICSGSGGLGYLDTADSMNINVNISIPYNSLVGQQTDTITVTGTAM